MADLMDRTYTARESHATERLMLISGVLVVVAIVMLIVRRSALRGTTLMGPWIWLLASLIAIAAAEYVVQGRSGNASALRLAATVMTLCPAISALGAKRPQDKVWHFIVASLWLVIALPALQRIVLGKTGDVQLHSAQSWFLAILMLFGVLNWLFGRFGLCVLLGGFGQAIMLSPFLPGGVALLRDWNMTWGVSIYALSIVLAAVLSYRFAREGPSLDSVWRAFRDAFGFAWAFRVAERLNATSLANGWNLRVTWGGIQNQDGGPLDTVPAEKMRAFRQALYNLLRRFVDESWINQRLDGPS